MIELYGQAVNKRRQAQAAIVKLEEARRNKNRLLISAANFEPNRFYQKRTVSWQTPKRHKRPVI